MSVSENERWPIEPGDYMLGSPESPLAISTLSDEELFGLLAKRMDRGKYAILGMTRTQNIGVEKLVRNVAANPRITLLALVGRDSEEAPVAPVILELSRRGLDDGLGLLVGGRRVRLSNLSPEEVDEFRRRVQVVDLSGSRDPEVILRIADGLSAPRGPTAAPTRSSPARYVKLEALDDPDVVLDSRGFFIIYVDRARSRIICEHYDPLGRKTAEISGTSAKAIYKTAIRMGLLSRLDHAAYLGRELARAECSLSTGEEYVQDRA